MKDKIIRYSSSIFASLVAIFICFGLLDLLWLGVIAGNWYQAEMKSLMRVDVIVWPWLAFYLLYGFVTFVLAVVANRDKSVFYAGIDGALLGLASYGTYNLTNYSVIEGFSLFIALVDWSWGIFLTSCSAMAGWKGFQLMRQDQPE